MLRWDGSGIAGEAKQGEGCGRGADGNWQFGPGVFGLSQLWGVGKPIRGGGSFRGMEAIKNLNKGCFQTPGDKYNLGKAKFLYLPSVWCIILAEEDNI